MATVSKRGKFIYERDYEEDDLVDDVFFSELSKNIVLTKLVSPAKHLDLPEAEFDFLQDFMTQGSSVGWVSSINCFENVRDELYCFSIKYVTANCPL